MPSCLPWELHCLIFSFADTPTLHSLCLVSYDVLKVAGPLLYRVLDLNTWSQIDHLFLNDRLIDPGTRLYEPLSLHHTYFLTITTPPRFLLRPPRPRPVQPRCPAALELRSFTLQHRTITSHAERFHLFTHVFPSVNPASFVWSSCPEGDLGVDDRTGRAVSGWDRLTFVRLAGLFPDSIRPDGGLQFLFRTLPSVRSPKGGRRLVWDFKRQRPREGSDWFRCWTDAVHWLKLFKVFENPSVWKAGVAFEVDGLEESELALEAVREALEGDEAALLDVIVL